ncbi:MAG: cupin domain-containing protein, partial [Bacteroidales bacterium]|nr:cupin domain-containing protein [Bacteroidales bacterium]
MENVFDHSAVYSLVNGVEYSQGAIVSKIVRKNDAGNITLFAFDKDQALSEHSAPFDAIVVVLDGEATISIDKKPYQLK